MPEASVFPAKKGIFLIGASCRTAARGKREDHFAVRASPRLRTSAPARLERPAMERVNGVNGMLPARTDGCALRRRLCRSRHPNVSSSSVPESLVSLCPALPMFDTYRAFEPRVRVDRPSIAWHDLVAVALCAAPNTLQDNRYSAEAGT